MSTFLERRQKKNSWENGEQRVSSSNGSAATKKITGGTNPTATKSIEMGRSGERKLSFLERKRNQGILTGRVSMDGGSYTALTPKPGMNDEEELRRESRYRTQIAKGATQEELAVKAAVRDAGFRAGRLGGEVAELEEQGRQLLLRQQELTGQDAPELPGQIMENGRALEEKRAERRKAGEEKEALASLLTPPERSPYRDLTAQQLKTLQEHAEISLRMAEKALKEAGMEVAGADPENIPAWARPGVTVGATARGAYTPKNDHPGEKGENLVAERDKWQGIVNDIGREYYDRQNEEQAAKLAGDKEGQAGFRAVEDILADIRILGDVATGEPENEESARARAALRKKYGLTERELEVEATGLISQLQGELETAKEAVGAAGYDYDKMTAYQDRLAQNERAAEGQRHTVEYAHEHPRMASAESTLATPAQMFDYIGMALKGIGHSDPTDLDNYIPANAYDAKATNFVRNVRGTVSADLAEKYGLEIGGTNIAAFLYQTGMSMSDFLYNAMLTGNFTGGWGGGTELGKKAAENLSLAIMGSGAAANTTVEAIERGLSNRQAYALGAIAGIAEIVTEKVSLETLLDKTAMDKSAWGYICKNILAEGSEEVASDLINWAGDVLVSRDRSEWAQAIQAYRDKGLTEREAFQAALKDQVISMGWSGLGGGLSGGLMAGSGVAVNEVTKWANGSGADGTGRFGTGPYEGVENRLLSESDLEEYLAVGEREHVRNLKKEQIKAGESPILTTIGQVKSFIRAALSGNVRNTIKGYGKVGARLAEDLQAAGIDATGYYLELDANRIAHLSDHVTEDGDTRNIPLTQEQAENLAEYIDNYDDLLDVVRKKDGSIRIYLGKKINGHAVIVELLSKGRKSLQPVTAWQNKTEHYLKKYGKAKVQKGGDGKPPALPNQIDTSRPTADAADISGYKSAPSAISVPQENGDVNGQVPAPEDGDVHYSLKETARAYEGKDLSKDGSVYGYEFLTSLPDMTVTSLPEVGTIQGKDGRINARTVVNLGMENARKVGVEKDGKVFVRNSYTKKQLQITGESIRHGISGKLNRLLTNARLGTVIGELAQNAVPINALLNKAEDVTGTYAMAGYATDSKGREFVGILTVEQRTGRVVDLEVYDMLHAVSGRQKNSSQASTKLQGLNPIKAAKISIADLLETVKSTHQSILSEDVLNHFGEKRNPKGDYTDKVLFSIKDAEATAGETSSITGETEMSSPLTQADAKRFATETGTENGLVLDDYVQKHLRPEKAKQLNTLAKALGVRVRFVNSIRGGTANASIRGNEVRIERYNPNPVTFLLGHELTHRMQSLSPEAYARFKEAVRSEAEKEAQALHSLYRIRGENIDFEGAMDEATANYAGRLLEEGPVLDEFIQRHRTDRSLLEKVLDAVRDILSKLTGQERKQAETAESKLLEALEETAEKVKKNGGETAAIKSGEENYSLKGKAFTEDKYFSRLMDKWSELPANGRVKVGQLQTGSALVQVGIPASGMYFDVGKIRKAMEIHGDHLTAEVLKGIPDLLNDPIVITEYTGPEGTIKNTVNVYGNLFISGTPVVVGVVMHRDINGQAIISNIRTVHARSDFAKQITDQSVLYLNEDKKRTRSWFHVCGNLNVPLDGTKYGLIRSITFSE